MRLSQMLFVTLRDDPAEAEIPSHKLLMRAGYIRRIGSGIYTYLPLMWRVLQKVSRIVREEMDATGAQECLLPQLQPAELWRESGRWDTYTKAEGIMFALRDRQERELGLGPTHEEVITTVAKELIQSYRQLPTHLYQIQTKFRDEIRPRFGLMRGREFIMKDGYSFHANEDSLKETYATMYQAYSNILRRCGLAFRAVEADSGAIGGAGSHEFMVLAEAGEDQVLYTEDGKYAANVEKAIAHPADLVPSTYKKQATVDTPGADTIEALVKTLDCHPTQIVKQVLYQATYDTGKRMLCLVSLRGDQDVNEVKLTNALTNLAKDHGAATLINLTPIDRESPLLGQGFPFGAIGPDIGDDWIQKGDQVHPSFVRFADTTVQELKGFVTGANQAGTHLVGVQWGNAMPLPKQVLDLRKVQVGDRANHDPTQLLQSARGIEIGHIFQLGTKYSAALGATFTTESGQEAPLVMGCYGVGVSRLAQAAVEQSYDDNGIIWPVAIAPYQAIVIVPNIKDEAQRTAAEQLYSDLNAAGIDTLLDDRDERAGVKFKDAELIGIPYRIVTGRGISEGKVEVVPRATLAREDVAIDQVVSQLKGWIQGAIE